VTDYFGAMGTAIYSTLAAGTALITELGGTAIYQDFAPDGAARPYLIYNHQGGGNENLTHSGLKNNVWFVRGYANTRAKAVAIDAKIDALLNKRTLSITGFTNFWTVRELDQSAVELMPNNSRIYMAGAFYRIRVTS
jgi:hypothetical protein